MEEAQKLQSIASSLLHICDSLNQSSSAPPIILPCTPTHDPSQNPSDEECQCDRHHWKLLLFMLAVLYLAVAGLFAVKDIVRDRRRFEEAKRVNGELEAEAERRKREEVGSEGSSIWGN
jgi:hypothetical protein